jgi:hypothetical protein
VSLPVTIAAKTVTAANPRIEAIAGLIKQAMIQRKQTICGLRAQPDLDQAADGFKRRKVQTSLRDRPANKDRRSKRKT